MTKVWFLLKLLLFSLPLFMVHDGIALGYQQLLLLFCSLLLPAGQQSVNLGYESSLRLIPYLALLLATPNIPGARRLLMGAVGLGVFLCIDLASILLWQAPPQPGAAVPFAHLLYSLIWDMLGHWLLPFVLWLILVNRHLGQLFAPGRPPAVSGGVEA